MTRARRLLSRADPARHLGPVLDERAEAELAALTGAQSVAMPRSVERQHMLRRRRLQPVLTTGLVAAAVAAISVMAIVNSPAPRAVSGQAISAPTVTSPARLSPASSASPAPSSGPMSTYSGPLIALHGARAWTREQLHARLSASPAPTDPANAAIREEQDWLNIQCMAAKGYLYDPTIDGTYSVEPGNTYGLTPQQQKGYLAAFWGPAYPDTAEPYDWRTAGCQGRSVHLTGQDDAH